MTKNILRFLLILTSSFFVAETCFAYLSAEERFERVKEYLSDDPTFTSHTQSRRVVEDFYEPDLAYVREEYSHARNSAELLDALQALNVRVKRYMWEKQHPGTLSFTELNTIVYTWVSILSSHVIPQDSDILSTAEGSRRPSLKESILTSWMYLVSEAHVRSSSRGASSYVDYADTSSITIPFVGKTGIIPVPLFNRSWGFYLPNGRTSAVIWLGCPTDPKGDFDYLREAPADQEWYHDYEHAQRGSLFASGFMQTNSAFFACLNQKITQTEDPQDRRCLELSMHLVCHETQHSVIPKTFFEYVESGKKSIDTRLESGIGTQNGIRVRDNGFYSLRQYENNVETARSLGLTIPDFSEIEDYETRILHQQREFYRYESLGHDRLRDLFKPVYTEVYGPKAYERFMQVKEAEERISKAQEDYKKLEEDIRPMKEEVKLAKEIHDKLFQEKTEGTYNITRYRSNRFNVQMRIINIRQELAVGEARGEVPGEEAHKMLIQAEEDIKEIDERIMQAEEAMKEIDKRIIRAKENLLKVQENYNDYMEKIIRPKQEKLNQEEEEYKKFIREQERE